MKRKNSLKIIYSTLIGISILLTLSISISAASVELTDEGYYQEFADLSGVAQENTTENNFGYSYETYYVPLNALRDQIILKFQTGCGRNASTIQIFNELIPTECSRYKAIKTRWVSSSNNSVVGRMECWDGDTTTWVNVKELLNTTDTTDGQLPGRAGNSTPVPKDYLYDGKWYEDDSASYSYFWSQTGTWRTGKNILEGKTALYETAIIWNLSDSFLNENTFGTINFTETFNIPAETNLSDYITISENTISVDSSGLPELNKPATLTFNNLTFTTPEVLKNGDTFCSGDGCPGYSYINGTLIISVPGFSTYTVREYVAPPAPVVENTDSGSSFGGCTTDWRCTEWSACNNGEQSRTCSKISNICHADSKPSETQTCNIASKTTEEIPTESTTEETSTSPGITGAVIGAMTSNHGALPIAFMIIVLGAGTVVFVSLRKKKLKFKK